MNEIRYYCQHCWVVFRDVENADRAACPHCGTSCPTVELIDDYLPPGRISPAQLINILYE